MGFPMPSVEDLQILDAMARDELISRARVRSGRSGRS
jgi:hypothetical protein